MKLKLMTLCMIAGMTLVGAAQISSAPAPSVQLEGWQNLERVIDDSKDPADLAKLMRYWMDIANGNFDDADRRHLQTLVNRPVQRSRFAPDSDVYTSTFAALLLTLDKEKKRLTDQIVELQKEIELLKQQQKATSIP